MMFLCLPEKIWDFFLLIFYFIMNTKIKLAVQKSGRLSQKTLEFLSKSGFNIEVNGRMLVGKCNNFPLEILFLRAKNIPEIVKDGVTDLGICGKDTILESGFSDLQEMEKLGFGKCRLSLSANKKMDISGKRIATSFPKILQSYLDKNNIKAEIVPFSGSVEIAPRLGIADLICDLISTGSTLKMNGLQELENIFDSQAVLLASKNFNPQKKEWLEKFLMRIRTTLLAGNSKYIIMNAPRSALKKIQELVPGLNSPTVTPLVNPEMISIASVVREDQFWETIEKMKSLGASGILVQPIEKIIL